jgi:glycosyltransferase involved in cell wall biosynthesis
MTKPRVSVVIDTYNHERYVEQAVISVCEQDFPAAETEILVIDDGSTDRTAEIVRGFAPRVRLVQKENGGQASAFNTGIRQAQAEIVAFLDGDDWFAPNKLSVVVKALEDNPQVAAIGHARYNFDEETKKVTIPPEIANTVLNGRSLLRATTPGAAHEASKAWPFLMTSAVTARKSLLNRIVPIPESSAPSDGCVPRNCPRACESSLDGRS